MFRQYILLIQTQLKIFSAQTNVTCTDISTAHRIIQKVPQPIFAGLLIMSHNARRSHLKSPFYTLQNLAATKCCELLPHGNGNHKRLTESVMLRDKLPNRCGVHSRVKQAHPNLHTSRVKPAHLMAPKPTHLKSQTSTPHDS